MNALHRALLVPWVIYLMLACIHNSIHVVLLFVSECVEVLFSKLSACQILKQMAQQLIHS